MGTARNVITEKWFCRIDLIEHVEPFDGIVGHSCRKIPLGFANVRVNGGRVAEQIRLPLARVTADESIEVFEAHPDWPLVKWPDLAGRERWCIVVLAEP